MKHKDFVKRLETLQIRQKFITICQKMSYLSKKNRIENKETNDKSPFFSELKYLYNLYIIYYLYIIYILFIGYG